jgi:hypothetical protein
LFDTALASAEILADSHFEIANHYLEHVRVCTPIIKQVLEERKHCADRIETMIKKKKSGTKKFIDAELE